VSDLRDGIGRRLAEIFAEHHGWDVEDAIKTIGGDTLRHQADECIRQMEWAVYTSMDPTVRENTKADPLTPAPDDWKPE